MSIYFYFSNNTIAIYNINKIVQKEKLINTILHTIFDNGSLVFMELYRENGVNMKRREVQLHKSRLSEFFSCNRIKKSYNQYLQYAKATVSCDFFQYFPFILDYYQEVTFFVPCITWNVFEKMQSHYLNRRIEDYLSYSNNGVVFQHVDGSDFLICCSNQEKLLLLQKIIISYFNDNNTQ